MNTSGQMRSFPLHRGIWNLTAFLPLTPTQIQTHGTGIWPWFVLTHVYLEAHQDTLSFSYILDIVHESLVWYRQFSIFNEITWGDWSYTAIFLECQPWFFKIRNITVVCILTTINYDTVDIMNKSINKIRTKC